MPPVPRPLFCRKARRSALRAHLSKEHLIDPALRKPTAHPHQAASLPPPPQLVTSGGRGGAARAAASASAPGWRERRLQRPDQQRLGEQHA